MHPSAPTGSTSPAGERSPAAQRLLDRLDRLGEVLRDRGDALALLGLGSVGRDLHRLDEHSDLDFFAVVEDSAKADYLTRLDWLEAAAPVAFSFPNTVDGRKVLFQDGIYAEYAVFTLAELRQAAYPPGRVVWQRADAPDRLDVPLRPPPSDGSDVSHAVNEVMTNLFVGLHRDARGEVLAALRLIQVHAVDRVLRILELGEGDRGSRQDLFAPERGVERQHRGRDLPLAAMAPGYGHNAGAARAVLSWLQAHCAEHLDPALLEVVEDLLAGAERREADQHR
jgi:hypothetical protein